MTVTHKFPMPTVSFDFRSASASATMMTPVRIAVSSAECVQQVILPELCHRLLRLLGKRGTPSLDAYVKLRPTDGAAPAWATPDTVHVGYALIGGVAIFALTKIAERLLLDPVHEQRKVIGEIDVALTHWAWAYANPGLPTPAREKAADEIRLLAGRLIGATNAIRWWLVASALLGAVRGDKSRQAGKYLIGISNQILTRPDLTGEGWGPHNSRSADRIRTLLKIPSLEEREEANDDRRHLRSRLGDEPAQKPGSEDSRSAGPDWRWLGQLFPSVRPRRSVRMGAERLRRSVLPRGKDADAVTSTHEVA